MVYLVSNLPAASESIILRGMFMARKRVFVDLLRWDVPVLGGLYEVDQFDTPDAAYIVLSGADGSHRASARLLPSDKPHILGALYSELCEAPLPSGPSIREITRFCLEPKLGTKQRRAARDELICALVAFALKNGITHYTGVADARWLDQILGFGWRCTRLGQLSDIGGSRLGAVLIEIDDETPKLLKRGGIDAPAVFAGAAENDC